jgi:hypothetical protein
MNVAGPVKYHHGAVLGPKTLGEVGKSHPRCPVLFMAEESRFMEGFDARALNLETRYDRLGVIGDLTGLLRTGLKSRILNQA